ncbi:putative DNA primase [Betaentomopoxvirus amoorei]|uniref:AMV143 n=1 Tax=Amsacta moorei entomopoxvirus TaxID=28321 RepID=Q9EMQ6_AMEPV|nr:putative DNA primase [Amsacta moorei entomopoxvirus]AAG02849.1 AMV143 [Amsacta moorei entomopoxvirus]
MKLFKFFLKKYININNILFKMLYSILKKNKNLQDYENEINDYVNNKFKNLYIIMSISISLFMITVGFILLFYVSISIKKYLNYDIIICLSVICIVFGTFVYLGILTEIKMSALENIIIRQNKIIKKNKPPSYNSIFINTIQ